MKLYSAADLHSNNHFLTIIDEQDRRILEKRLPNELSVTLKTLEPYRADISGIAVESTFYARFKITLCLLEAAFQNPIFSASRRSLGQTGLRIETVLSLAAFRSNQNNSPKAPP